jgi:hypothetical protein
MVPVDDAALAVTDTGGPAIPVVYLNGQFATQGYWRQVLVQLGTGWRHITYDERARGKKSNRSADYSFEAAVQDVDAVLAARGVDRPLRGGLVLWSARRGALGQPESRPRPGRGPGRRRIPVRLARLRGTEDTTSGLTATTRPRHHCHLDNCNIYRRNDADTADVLW